MRYLDTGIRSPEQAVATWFEETVASGISAFSCQVGYFTLDGCSILLPVFRECAESGASLKFVLGSNGGVTLASHIAYLAGAIGVPRGNVALGVVSYAGSLFHPKVYHFVREDSSQTAYVGSANLTSPGVNGHNIEAGLVIDTASGDDARILDEISERIASWFNDGSGLLPITGHPDIDALLANKTLANEPDRSSRDGQSGQDDGDSSRNGSQLPRIAPLRRLPSISIDEAANGAPRLSVRGDQSANAIRSYVNQTEASFHYPQGTHLGHILSILMHFSDDRTDSAFDNEYIRLRGSLGEARLAAYRRQVKYKLLAAMELGLLTDIRVEGNSQDLIQLTELGTKLWELINPYFERDELEFHLQPDGIFSTTLPHSPSFYNQRILSAIGDSEPLNVCYLHIFLNMAAVQQLLMLLYWQARTTEVSKNWIYENFFDSEPVRTFCDRFGIETATAEGARHRCPFLINILESCGIVSQSRYDVVVRKFVVFPDLFVGLDEPLEIGIIRMNGVIEGWSSHSWNLTEEDRDAVENLLGDSILTDHYYIRELIEVPTYVE